jgi:hypothetical protein
MNIRNRFILTNLLIFLLCNVSMAQKVKTNSMGKALVEFINSQKVIDNFKHLSNQQDSLIVLVDLKNIINGYPINTWRGYKVTVLKNGSLVDSLKLFDAHYLLKNRCDYYVLMSRMENKNVTAITLRHPCTNVVSNIKITEKNHLFYLGKIENAVW